MKSKVKEFMKSTMENMKNTGMNMQNMLVKEKEKFLKTLMLTEIGQRKRMETGTRRGTGIRTDRKKKFMNNMMETTRNIFLKTEKAPIEQILSARSTELRTYVFADKSGKVDGREIERSVESGQSRIKVNCSTDIGRAFLKWTVYNIEWSLRDKNDPRTFEGRFHFCGPSTLTKDRPILVLLTVKFYQTGPFTFPQDRSLSPRPIRTTNSANRLTLPQRGIIFQKLGKKKCWILLVILLLSIVGIAVGLSVHFTATDSSPTTTTIPLLNATTASPISTTSRTQTTTTTTTNTTTEGQNTSLTLTTTTIKATSTSSSLTPGKTGSSLEQCINSCGNDISCETKCVNQFKCQDQPTGCSTSRITTSTMKTISLQITSTSKSTTTTLSTTATSTTPTIITTTTTTSTSTTTTLKTTTSKMTTSATTTTSKTETSTASTITTARPTNLEPNRNAVLVLSTLKSNEYFKFNKPFIVDFDGNVNEDLDFEYGEETRVARGCGALLRNVFWYFGGGLTSTRRQASKIVGCKMERQTDLTFDFKEGACNEFNEPDPKILLCFDWNNNKECHTFDGETYQSAGTSAFSHTATYGLANYRGRALTTGCLGDSCGVKTELMDMNTLTWSIGPDYPFTSNQIYLYSTASTSEAAYIIGNGAIGGSSTYRIIAEFKNDAWSQFGTLAKGRYYHGSISLGNEFMVIGGYSSDGSDVETEIWNFENGNNKIINPILPNNDYGIGIGLYLVPFDFCT